MTDDDPWDYAIVFGCLIGLFSWIAFEAGQFQAKQDKTYCATTLADGRELTTRWINDTGEYRCTYAPSYGRSKKYRQG